MKKSTMTTKNYMKLPGAFVGVVLFFVAGHLLAVTQLGNPFTPSGANYTIYARQGIDSAHATGNTSFSPQVNKDFEFTPSIGVSYDTGGGTLKDFGLGLYTSGASTFSTGLNIQYNQLVNASSISITVQDFDIKAGASFFNSGKVEPSILLFGPGNSIFASFLPKDIFPNLKPVSGKNDVWTINFSDLLNTLHLSDGQVSGFLLYADTTDGEKANSDPYLLLAVGNGIPVVPEAGNFVVGLAAIAFGGLFHLRQLRRKRNAVTA
jgi:hypothetical protein